MKKAIIIGYPVGHARSPLIHGYWLGKMGIKGDYERAEVKPGDVAAALRRFGREGYAGGNVTVPHKEEAFLACDHVSEAARRAGAVNTFWYENGQLVGDNTDGAGFAAHLEQQYPGWNNPAASILILGAGGAARGLIGPLAARKPRRIRIANRSPARAQTLCDAFAQTGVSIEALAWEAREAALADTSLLINTTSQGMAGQAPLDIALDNLPKTAIVADIVYVPLETALLADARKRGLPVLDGLGMLLHQAVPGFERWFGARPVVDDALRARIVEDLLSPAPRKEG
ncbi:MAG: shikimate dehydrogenase [Proteobacteria bacterium]|nr:shikimate dehydrogenase [Pseudomonadota bacterium]